MWLAIDTNILVDASGQGVHAFAEASNTLLKTLESDPQFILAIDPHRRLLIEYQNRVNSLMMAHHWLERLRRADRIRVVANQEIPKGARVALLEAHLHQEDWHLVRAALGSSRFIVTRDFQSFSNEVATILRRRLDIKVLGPAAMLEYLETEANEG